MGLTLEISNPTDKMDNIIRVEGRFEYSIDPEEARTLLRILKKLKSSARSIYLDDEEEQVFRRASPLKTPVSDEVPGWMCETPAMVERYELEDECRQLPLMLDLEGGSKRIIASAPEPSSSYIFGSVKEIQKSM